MNEFKKKIVEPLDEKWQKAWKIVSFGIALVFIAAIGAAIVRTGGILPKTTTAVIWGSSMSIMTFLLGFLFGFWLLKHTLLQDVTGLE